MTSNPLLIAFLIGALSYVLGSIPFGLIVGKLRGVDLRTVGSKNIGATNAGRILGKAWGVLVFLLDAVKGYLPVIVVGQTFEHAPLSTDLRVAIAFISVVMGHVFSIFLRGRGGKGVATGLGGVVAISSIAGGLALVAYLVGALVFKSESVPTDSGPSLITGDHVWLNRLYPGYLF